MLFTTGVNDEQVSYWEPLKMVSKLRYFNPENADKFIIQIRKDGHGGSNNLSDHWQESAIKNAFILNHLGR